jgi:hypothetical protein
MILGLTIPSKNNHPTRLPAFDTGTNNMKNALGQSRHNKQNQLLRFFVATIGLLGLFVIAAYVAFGQVQVRRGGGPARVRYGGGGSVRYGNPHAYGGRSRMLPSEERYVKSARGLLPSQERYRRATSGMLPSAGRYGYMTSGIHRNKSLAMQVQSNIHRGMGTIRYGGAPARYSVPVRPKIPTAVAIKPRPYTPAIAPKAYVPSRAYSAQGSIRYGAATSLSPKYVQQSKSLSPVGKKGFSLAPEIVLAHYEPEYTNAGLFQWFNSVRSSGEYCAEDFCFKKYNRPTNETAQTAIEIADKRAVEE